MLHDKKTRENTPMKNASRIRDKRKKKIQQFEGRPRKMFASEAIQGTQNAQPPYVSGARICCNMVSLNMTTEEACCGVFFLQTRLDCGEPARISRQALPKAGTPDKSIGNWGALTYLPSRARSAGLNISAPGFTCSDVWLCWLAGTSTPRQQTHLPTHTTKQAPGVPLFLRALISIRGGDAIAIAC